MKYTIKESELKSIVKKHIVEALKQRKERSNEDRLKPFIKESDLNRIVKESVNRVLNEWEYAGWVNDIGDDDYVKPDGPNEYDFDTKIWGLADDELPKYLEGECNRLGLYFKGFSCPKAGKSFYQGFIRDRDGKEYAEITIEVKQPQDQL